MIGPMGRAGQSFDESLKGDAMADSDRHNQSPKMFPSRLGKMLLNRPLLFNALA